jgi:hypothetical protein
MNRRSQGTVKRKEDDINLMDINGFCRYLNTIYEYPTEPEHNICCGTIYITIPLFVYNNIRRSILLYPDGGCALVRGPLFDRWPDDLKKYLNTQYFVEYKMDENKDYMYFIGPNEGKGDNKFFIKLLDDIIIHVDYPLLRKKVNESHWSEMNRRSQGIKVRKEDDNMERFRDYLKDHYKTGRSFIEVFYSDNPKYYKNKQYTWLAVPMCDTVDRSLCLVLNEVDGERYITTSNIMLNRFRTNKNKIESVFLVKEERRDYDVNAPQINNDIYWPDEVTSSDNGHSYMRGSPYGSVRLIPKDGSEITNTYFINAINFLIDNMDNYDLTIEKK